MRKGRGGGGFPCFGMECVHPAPAWVTAGKDAERSIPLNVPSCGVFRRGRSTYVKLQTSLLQFWTPLVFQEFGAVRQLACSAIPKAQFLGD